MDNVDPQAVTEVNEPTRERFQLEVERTVAIQRHNAITESLSRKHEQELRAFDERKREIDNRIWQAIDEHRDELIEPGKRSFVTMPATFQLREVPAKTTILDKKGIMQAARRLRVVRHIANPPKIEWSFDQKKFLAWLAKNSDLRTHFESFLDDVDARESLTIQPNSGYTVLHDSKRISPPPITIRKG